MSLRLAIHSADAVLRWVAAALPSILAPTAPAVEAGLLVQVVPVSPVGLVADETPVVPSTRTRKAKTQAKDRPAATAAGAGTKSPRKRSVKKTNSVAKR